MRCVQRFPCLVILVLIVIQNVVEDEVKNLDNTAQPNKWMYSRFFAFGSTTRLRYATFRSG